MVDAGIVGGECRGGGGAWRVTGISARPCGLVSLDCNHQRILVESIASAISGRRTGRNWRTESGKQTDVARGRFERVAAIHFTASGGRDGKGVPVSDTEWLRVHHIPVAADHGDFFFDAIRGEELSFEGTRTFRGDVFPGADGLPDFDFTFASVQFLCV